ncbi:MAG: hypothetical protein WCV85_00565 [Patescibacteria group bacterium]|jgi:hypothetical protein
MEDVQSIELEEILSVLDNPQALAQKDTVRVAAFYEEGKLSDDAVRKHFHALQDAFEKTWVAIHDCLVRLGYGNVLHESMTLRIQRHHPFIISKCAWCHQANVPLHIVAPENFAMSLTTRIGITFLSKDCPHSLPLSAIDQKVMYNLKDYYDQRDRFPMIEELFEDNQNSQQKERASDAPST